MSSIRSRAPKASSGVVRKVMQAVRRRDTTPEIVIRRGLFEVGLRYRVNSHPVPTLPIKADVIFPRARVAVFVDGCFWHGCPRHFRLPRANTSWWKEKVEDNVRRDRRNTKLLKRSGWRVVRIWEHEVTSGAVSKMVSRVVALVRCG
jgi:DNA mismatch endonuclease (patch repair protein)